MCTNVPITIIKWTKNKDNSFRDGEGWETWHEGLGEKDQWRGIRGEECGVQEEEGRWMRDEVWERRGFVWVRRNEGGWRRVEGSERGSDLDPNPWNIVLGPAKRYGSFGAGSVSAAQPVLYKSTFETDFATCSACVLFFLAANFESVYGNGWQGSDQRLSELFSERLSWVNWESKNLTSSAFNKL